MGQDLPQLAVIIRCGDCTDCDEVDDYFVTEADIMKDVVCKWT